MTIKELEKLKYLDTLISVTSDRIRELEERLDVGAQVITDMPRTPGIKDRIGDIVPDIADQRTRLERAKERYEDEKRRIVEYIDSVEDYQVHLILTLRYVSFMSWAEVADAIGGGNTEASVKKAFYRFIG